MRFSPAAAALLGVAMLSIAAGTASATVYYASPTGVDSNSGTSAASPWTLSKANGVLAPGDVVILLPGTYTTSITPSASGTGSNSRITYIGSISNPAATVVPAVDLNKAWITVKGMTGTDGLGLDYPALHDSIAYCVGAGGHFYGAKYCTIAKSTINGTFAFLLDAAQTLSGTADCEYDTLRGNAINLGQIPSSHGFKIRGYTQNCLIDSNRVVGTFTQTGTNDGCGRIFYNSSNNILRDNFWQFDATNDYNANKDAWNGFVLRDSARNYTFERDTIYMGLNSGPYGVHGMLCTSGSFVTSVANNSWTNCVFKTNSYVGVQDGLRGVTLERCQFISQDEAFYSTSTITNTTIDHCTFYAPGQTLRFDADFGGGNNITSNIVYSGSAGAIGNWGAQAQYASNGTTGFSQDYNVFFTPSFTSTPGDRSLEWCCYTGSSPGPGTPWASLNGQDTHSVYGSPLFVDSTFTTFDARLRAGSRAIGAGVGGSDAGAIPFDAGSVDNTPPAAITNLAISNVAATNLLLSWSAPGDDGNVGTAFAYDLRVSNSPINAGNFLNATPVSPQPQPLIAGSAQSYVASGLTPGTTYYYAIRTRDEMNNWSPISNVVSATTASADTTPPAAIKDLSTGP